VYGFILFSIIMLMGALIAFLGDRIGMRVGKRRLSLFGLRPRHTSIVITIMTGMLIALATFASLVVVSEDVRMAVFHIDEIRRALAMNREEFEDVQLRLEAALEKLEKRENETKELTVRIGEKAQQLEKMIEQRDEAKADLEKINQQFQRAGQALEKAHNDLNAERERVKELQATGEKMRMKVSELEQVEAVLSTKVSYLLEEYQHLDERYRRLSERARFGDMTYGAGDIVSARVVSRKGSAADVEQQLLNLLLKANQVALERGARIKGKDNYALQLVSQEHFEQVTEAIADGRSEELVVRVTASRNSLAGEPVIAHFEIIPRRLVFRKGEVIGSRVVHKGAAGEIENAVLGLLREVNQRAVEAGMITDANGLVGQVSGAQFLDVIAAIKGSGTSKEVQVLAAEDVWTTEGPIRIQIQAVDG